MKAIILSISSDIGKALSITLKERGYEIYGTYNLSKPSIGIPPSNLCQLDINDFDSDKYKSWLKNIGCWDLFISCIGTQEPIGKFLDVDVNRWTKAIAENSSYQIGALINAIKISSNKKSRCYIFCRRGTNSANPYYSSYTLGKISLIKAVELLDNEINNIKFSILGPGWVQTKIHSETINAKDSAGENFNKTLEMIKNPNRFNPMEKVIQDVLKIISLPKDLVGGRNFSSVNDDLSIENLKKLKKIDNDFYKLRRNLN